MNSDKKQSFGATNVNRVTPPAEPGSKKRVDVYLNFEQALKLQFSINQALAKLNTYNYSTREGQQAAVRLSIMPFRNRVMVLEGKLQSAARTADDVADQDDDDEAMD